MTPHAPFSKCLRPPPSLRQRTGEGDEPLYLAIEKPKNQKKNKEKKKKRKKKKEDLTVRFQVIQFLGERKPQFPHNSHPPFSPDFSSDHQNENYDDA